MKRLLLTFALLVAGVAAGDTPVSTTQCSETSPSQSECTATANVPCACTTTTASTPASSLLTGLVNYWAMDEASGTRADSAGSVTLTDVNTVGAVAGKHNNAASYVLGSAETLTAPGFSLPSGDMTLSFWLQPAIDNDDAQRGFFGIGTTWTSATALNIYWVPASDKLRLLCGDDAGAYKNVDSLTAVPFGSWYHVVVTYTASTKVYTIYVNGDAGASTPALTGGPYRTASTLWAGGRYNVAAYETHYLDEVGIWSRVLSADERATLYNSGAGKFYPTF